MNRLIIVIDTETGGLDFNKHGLMSLSAKVLNEEDNITLYMKQQIGKIYEPQALKINNISLSDLQEKGIELNEFATELFEWLAGMCSKYNREKIVLLGHNIRFDINFIKMAVYKYFEHINPFKNFIDYHILDTCELAMLLDYAGVITPPDHKLHNLYKYFMPTTQYQAHTSYGDVMMTEFIFNKMVEMVQNKDTKRNYDLRDKLMRLMQEEDKFK